MVYLAELLVVMTDRLKIVRIRARKCAPRTRKQLNKRTTTRLSLSLAPGKRRCCALDALGHCPVETQTSGQSNLTKSASRGAIPRLGVTPGGRKLYH